MSARVRLLLFIVWLILSVWLLRAVGSDAQIGAPHGWVTPQEVLVLFNARWPDENGNYRSDSQDVAEYYAARRGIPRDHLLGLAVTERQAKPDNLVYPDFFRRVLVPTRQRLTELGARGTHIYYLVTCYGMPLVINTNLDSKRNEHPVWQPSDYDARSRALTGWLVNLEENFEAGFDRVTGKPGPRGGASAAPGSKPLGAVLGDIALPWMRGAFDRPDLTNSFKTLRLASPARRESYLVTHLGGETLETSLGLVDKALYAERYLQNFAGRPAHPYYGRVWLDHDGGTGAGHRPSLFKGLLKTSVFASANRPQPWYQGPPWDVRMDNAEAEIGSRDPKDPAAPLHGATVSGVIERVDPLRSPGGGRRVVVNAQLAGVTPEQADDIALWQVEYGLTPEYGSVVPYIEWPDPGDDKFSQRRRYFYTRRLTHELPDLLPDREYHVRISARDSFGNVGTATGTVRTLP